MPAHTDQPTPETTPSHAARDLTATEKNTTHHAARGPGLPPQRATTLLPPPKKLTISDRLEEVANDRTSMGKHPARNAIDRYSPGPMPPIQDATPTSIFDNIHLETVKEWELRPGGKLIAIPFDSDARSQENHEFLRTKILTAVAELITAQEISVAAPRPTEEAERKGRTPTSFLIYNITPEQADSLLQRKVWSSRAVTFRVTPFATTCPTFLFTIKDFATTAMKDVYDLVKNIWDNETTRSFIDTTLEDVPAEERRSLKWEAKLLLASMNVIRLDIKVAGNALHPHFNVYADCSQFSDDKIWSRIRSYLFSAAYISSIQGRATTEKIPFRCSCCHGVDHPRGLCPFPNLTGWNGPRRDNSGNFNQRRNGNAPYFDKRAPRQRFQPHP